MSKRRAHQTVAIVGAGLTLSPLTAFAAEGGPTAYAGEGGEPASVSSVTVKSHHKNNDVSLSRLPAGQKDIAQSITVLSKPLLQSEGANSLADALRNVPGITIGGAEGGQIGNNINLNGFTARTDIFLDGFRDRGQYYRDTFALEDVDVLMGPSSMLFGRGSTGGAINQVSKKPNLTPATEADISGTTNGLVRGTADLNAPLSDVSAFRFAVMGQDGAPGTRRKTTVNDYGVAPSYSYGIGAATQLTLSGLIQHNNDRPDYGVSPLNGHPVDSGFNTVYGYANDRTIQDVKAGGVEIRHDFGGGLNIRDQVQYNGVDVDARETAPQSIGTVGPGGYAALAAPVGAPAADYTESTSLPLGDLYARLQSHDRTIHDTSLFNQFELTAKATTGPFTHDLLIGSEIGHDEYKNQAYTRTGTCNGVPMGAGYTGCVSVLNPAYTAAPSLSETAGDLATGKADTLAGYVNDTLSVSSWLKLVGGLRYDNYAATITNSITSATAVARMHQTVDYTSVRAGAILQPTKHQSYYVSYSTSFDPSLEQLTSTTGANAPLPSETNAAYEVGGKWDVLHDQLDLTAAVFQITQDNARSANSDGTYSATGNVRVRGERFGFSGHLTPQWMVFGGYSHLDAKIIKAVAVFTAGKVPLNTPKDTATAWTTYDITGQWQVGGGAVYMSSRYANNTDLVSVPSYLRWDATVAYRLPRYEVRLNLFNIFDTHYYDALIQSDGGRAVPGTGRTAMITLTWRGL